MKRFPLLGLVLAALMHALPVTALAQDFPSRRITLVVPFPAGSATDGTARRLAAELGKIGNVPVIVENKPGADGNIAAMSVLRSDADGYTVFVTTNSTHAANVNLFKQLPFDPKADFAPVSGIARIPIMLVVRPDFPARNIAEYIALAKASAAKPVTFGSGSQTGRGAGELLKERESLAMLNIPYKGSPQALTDLLGGHVDSLFVDPVAAAGLVQKGSVRVLAVTSAKRAPTMPDVPSLEEAGLPGFELIAWIAAFVPEKTPKAVVAKLNAMLNTVLKDPATAAYLNSTGATPFPTTPEQLAAFAEADTKRWARIVEAAKMEKQ
ncbi:MAG: tripartite tricarboxylate transporter substrate binding protein [Pseudomonadota bacterium]